MADSPEQVAADLEPVFGAEGADVVGVWQDAADSVLVLSASRSSSEGLSAPIDGKPWNLYLGSTDPETSTSVSESARSYKRKPATTVYGNYHKQVKALSDYRKWNIPFERLLFERPKEMAITAGKAAVQRPRQATPDEYDALEEFVSPPFKWMLENINIDIEGCRGGICELCEWMLDHRLEGSLFGRSMSVKTVQINGQKWRVIDNCKVYSGGQLGLAENVEDGDPHWYLRIGKGKKTEGYWNLWGWDQTDYSNRSFWEPMQNLPELGIYRDVISYGTVGNDDKYPTPKYLPLMDSLLDHDILMREQIATLAYMQRKLILWKFDFKVMQELKIPWKDITLPDGTKKTGALTQFRTAREAMLQQDKGGIREMSMPSYVSYEEYTPGTDLLTDRTIWFKSLYDIELAAGIMRDNDGELLLPESAEQKMAMFARYREMDLEPPVQKMFNIMIAENKRWWPQLGFQADPFVWRSKKASNRKPRSTSLRSIANAVARDKEDWIAGHIEDVRVLFEFVPSNVQSDKRAELMGQWAADGLISKQTFHEAGAAVDPDLEKARKLREATEDRVPLDTDTQPLWGKDTFTQTALVDRPSGTSSRSTQNEPSPGRPKDTPSTTPEDDTESSD